MFISGRRLFLIFALLITALIPLSSAPNSPVHAQSSSFRFITWSDTQGGLDVLARLSNQASALNPALTLFMGDAEAYGFTTDGADAWNNAMDGGSANGLKERVFLARGNRDRLDMTGWQAYYDFAARAAALGASNFSAQTEDLTYSFDYGNSHFIGVDVTGDVSLMTSAQIAWIDSDLTLAEARGLTHAFLFFHGPLYCVLTHCTCTERTCPTEPVVASLIEVVNRHPIVSAVFNGHEHLMAYTHIDSSRIPEVTHPFEAFQTSPSGGNPYTCSATRTDYCGLFQGFGVVDVDGPRFIVRMFADSNPEAIRSFSFDKSAPYDPTPTPEFTEPPTATPVPPDSMSLPPTADGYVSSGYPTKNYAAYTRLSMDGSPVDITYLKFDLSSLAGREIVSAVLRLRVCDTSDCGSGGMVEARSVADSSWTETGLTYNNRPALGSLISTFKGGTYNVWREVDVSGAIRAAAGGPLSIGFSTTSTDSFRFYSRENADFAPQLVIQSRAVIIPTATAEETATPTAEEVTPTPENTPSPTPDAGTPADTETPADTPSPTPDTGTPTETETPADTPTPDSDTPTPVDTPTDTPTPGDTPTETATPLDTPTPTPDDATPTPLNTPTPTPDDTPTPVDTPTPTPLPTFTPTPVFSPTPVFTLTPSDGLTLEPVDDIHVRSDYPTKNFVEYTRLMMDAVPVDLTYMKFDLSSLAGQTITSAVLRLRVCDTSDCGSGGTIELYQVPDTGWTEEAMTYNNRPAMGALVTTFKGGKYNTWREIDISSAANQAAGGFLSLGFSTNSSDSFRFFSKENLIGPQYNPHLVIKLGPPAASPTPTDVSTEDTPTPTAIVTDDTPTPTPVDDTPTPSPTPIDTEEATATPTPIDPSTPVDTPTPTPVVDTPAATATPSGSLSLLPAADIHVSSAYPTRNHAAYTRLSVDGSPIDLAYLKFDLASLAGKTVVSAKLRIRVCETSDCGSGGMIEIHTVSDSSWTETSMTYNNHPALGDLLTSFKGGTYNTWRELDLTGAVSSAAGGTLSLGFSTASTDSFRFYSRENATYAPQLVIVVAD